MSLTPEFCHAAIAAAKAVSFNGAVNRTKRLPPFSLRLSASERVRLIGEAAGIPLGTYIRAKLLGETPPSRVRRSGLAIKDRKALAQLLAALGRSRLASNLNQLAHLAHIGALPLNPEVEAELVLALRDIRELRRLLLVALGKHAVDAPASPVEASPSPFATASEDA